MRRDPSTHDPSRSETGSRPLLRTALGTVLRRLRREQRRTLADVARRADVSMPYLSELERGRKEASSEVLAAICDALGIDLPELLAEAGHELVGQAARPASVASVAVLAERRARRSPQRPGGTGDVRCALAA